MRVAYRHRVVKVVIFAYFRSTQPTFDLGKLSESGFTGLEDFQDKTGEGSLGLVPLGTVHRNISLV